MPLDARLCDDGSTKMIAMQPMSLCLNIPSLTRSCCEDTAVNPSPDWHNLVHWIAIFCEQGFYKARVVSVVRVREAR